MAGVDQGGQELKENGSLAMETAQKFSLGTLVSPSGVSAPSEVSLKIVGRGVFCQIELEYSFDADDPSVPRVFAVDRPWNAVLVSASINRESISKLPQPGEPLPLPAALKAEVGEVLQEGDSYGLCCHIEAGCSLRSISVQYTVACDVLWHKSTLAFHSPTDRTRVHVEVNWDLGGLPGASLACTGAASDSRYSPLDAAHSQWIETLELGRGEEIGTTLSLDERKAASLCLYSKEGASGCGAIVVVAPVRPQLVRKPVNLAVVVEVRNPQEGLLTRDLVDRLSSTLNPDDKISIFAMGSSVTRKLLDWSEISQLNEEVLAQLLEPSLMGKTQYFWESFQRVMGESEGATHILLATSGPKDSPPAGLEFRLPVFAFATGRKPNASTLGELISGSGGFLSESSVDGIDSFLQRLSIRLSPPLLKDFRLEAWSLEDSVPSGITQVYTDKPTLVLGRYEGLLPQTVTLCGFSPAGQKLAQRVRVEKFEKFSLHPLLEHAAQSLAGDDQNVQGAWQGSGVALLEVSKPLLPGDLFVIEEPAEPEPAVDLAGPPSIDIVSTAVTIDDGILGGPSDATIGDDLFSGSSADTITEDMFSGTSDMFSVQDDSADDFFGPGDGGSDFFSSQEEFSGGSFLDDPSGTIEGPPIIRASYDSAEGSQESVASPSAQEDTEFGGLGSVEPVGFDFSSGESEAPSFEESQEPSFEESRASRDSIEPVPSAEPEPSVEAEPSRERETRVSAERATLAVAPAMPNWVRRLVEMDNGSMEHWLRSCPLDTLALGLANTDEELAGSFLSKLTGARRDALETQIAWGRLLSKEEREQACLALEQRLAGAL